MSPEVNALDRFASAAGGVLLVDKPLDWTSFDVVKKVRGLFQVRKVGHAGTLDPLATGLLILCSGAMTRSIAQFQDMDKIYIGSFALGAVTRSYDAATPPEHHCSTDHITLAEVQAAADGFLGAIDQIPPMFSAVKVAGTRLYELARKGQEVEREPRRVFIADFTVFPSDGGEYCFSVTCTKGTYVRTLIHDLGQVLNVGAYITSLRRTAIGDFQVKDALTLEDVERAMIRRRERTYA